MTHDAGDLRARLRTATAAAHLRLEATLDLLHEPSERSRFVDLLKRFRSFHAAWEPALARCLAGDAEMLAVRSKLPLLDADLMALGVGAPAIDAACDAPVVTALCSDEPAALGSLYVLEGSTLGGKFISRHLARAASDWLPAAGLRYFDPYGDTTGARWKETMARLGDMPPGQWSRIEDGAVATFGVLEQWLAPPSATASGRATDISPGRSTPDEATLA